MTINRTIKLSSGQEYEVRAVSETLINLAKEAERKKFLERGEPVDPPTYEVEFAGGVKQRVYHDESSLVSDDDKAAWKAYQAALKRLDDAQNLAQMKVWTTGIIFEMPEDTSWMDMQKWLGVVIPDNPMDLRYHYLTTEILKTPGDLLQLLEAVTKLSYEGMVREEDIDAAMKTFRDSLLKPVA